MSRIGYRDLAGRGIIAKHVSHVKEENRFLETALDIAHSKFYVKHANHGQV